MSHNDNAQWLCVTLAADQFEAGQIDFQTETNLVQRAEDVMAEFARVMTGDENEGEVQRLADLCAQFELSIQAARAAQERLRPVLMTLQPMTKVNMGRLQ